ncbi:MAG: glutamyl-tRNA reductase [Thermodesulfobacteriota bacterium]|nr:glutamyl-tRNA reductase [Thermodesulfobacteriota bacterium]
MDIIIVGLNHKTAPIELREKISFPESSIGKPLKELVSLDNIKESLIVSTCNRVEILASTDDVEDGVTDIERFIAQHHGLDLKDITPYFYVHSSRKAVKHIFSVASSLDSMVLGEPQILGQVKDAYSYASKFGTSGTVLHKLLHKTFSVAKRVRSETEISKAAVSISYAAVELAKKIFDDLEGKNVLLIGAGEMAELAAKHLLSQGVQNIYVANRTFDRAVKLAEEFNGTPVPFNEIITYLTKIDIVICSTNAPHYVLKRTDVSSTLKLRKYKSMFFIDISVPRNLDPEINKVENAYLFDIDNLQNIIDANIQERMKEAKKAEKIIDDEVEQFFKWFEILDIEPTIIKLRQMCEQIRTNEVEKAFTYLGDDAKQYRKVIDSLSKAIVNKILHQPIVTAKNKDNLKKGHEYAQILRILFNLDEMDRESSNEVMIFHEKADNWNEGK